MLAKLEVAIKYKQVSVLHSTAKIMWCSELQGCQRVVEDWLVRALVLDPAKHQLTCLKSSLLCRKYYQLQLTH